MTNEFYKLEELFIGDIPILSRQLKSLSLYLDIDKLGIQLDCVFNDQLDLKNTVPIKGGETLTLCITDRWEKKFRKTFILTSFDVLTVNSPRDVDVNMKAITTVGFDAMTQRIATSYDNRTPSDIVTELIPTAEVSKTSNLIQLVSPGWTKTKLIEHLTRISNSEKYGPMFLCWEDFDGVKFKSLNEVYKTQKTVNSYLTNNRNPYYRYNILEHKEISTGNFAKSSNQQQFQRTYASYDPDSKQLITQTTKLADAGDSFNRLGKGQNFSNTALGMQSDRPILIGHLDESTMKAKYENELRWAEYDNRMHILTNGDFTQNPGTLINIDENDRYEKTEYSVSVGGLWVIEKVACHFDGHQFMQKIQLTRNASYNYDSKNSTIINPAISSNL